jgi:hypothetical protein
MSGFIKTGLALALFSLLLFSVVLLGTLFGWFAGWVVGLFFSDMLLPIFAGTFLKGVTLAHIGAFLGFVGGFFKSSLTTSK